MMQFFHLKTFIITFDTSDVEKQFNFEAIYKVIKFQETVTSCSKEVPI